MSPRALFVAFYGMFLGMMFVVAGNTAAIGSASEAKANPPDAPAVEPSDDPAWVDLARRIHKKHTGQQGFVAMLGDSITFTDAFWSPLLFCDPEKYIKKADGFPLTPDGKPWRDVILGLRAKGQDYCNGSGWQVGYILRAIDKVMEREKPEVAIIMVGTNDVGSGKCPPGYEEAIERIVEKCIDYKCIPVLTTIPPRRDKDEAVADANKYIRSVAKRKKLPLIDYHAEITRRQPMQRMYETLMSSDGIHPSGGKTNDFSEENLSKSGYALRNWLTFMMYREIYFRVLHPEAVDSLTQKNE